jgi:hypothetical protein
VVLEYQKEPIDNADWSCVWMARTVYILPVWCAGQGRLKIVQAALAAYFIFDLGLLSSNRLYLVTVYLFSGQY